MYCTNCGTPQESLQLSCSACGVAFPLNLPSRVEPFTSSFKTLDAQQLYLAGFGGWLVYFCIALSVGAAIEIRRAIQSHHLTYLLTECFFAATKLILVVLIATCNRNVFRWLWFFLATQLFASLFVWFGVANFAVNQTAALMAIARAILWFWYFKQSKRVLATFGRNL
jgi:hypothetical protein